MRIANIKYNDVVDGDGVCLSVWFQGCPHKCKGCHNPETWDFNGGYEIEYQELENIVLKEINKNGILRNLSLLGGEPLYMPNLEYTVKLSKAVHKKYPNIKIYCWTGFTYEALIKRYGKEILNDIDILIDGPFILNERDITLYLRGSKNQRVLYKGVDF